MHQITTIRGMIRWELSFVQMNKKMRGKPLNKESYKRPRWSTYMTYPMNENCYEQNQYASNYYHQMIRWKLSFVRPNNGSSNPTIRRFSRGWHSCMKDRGDRVYRYKCAYWRIFMLENKWRIFIFTFNPQLKGMKTSSPFDLETT